MINIEIIPEFRRVFMPDILERAAKGALLQPSAPDADLTLVLTGDTQIQVLDRDFLGKDAPTDVLSFPACETDPETGRRYLGDIIISVPRAEAQSIAAGHSLEAELSLLVVHGVLHLLGHDHAGAEEKARMWAAQSEVLTRLGISPTIVYG
ncbi:MAG: rRNA maturation RNase YbeY [Chloroflexi bacterium]|nr:rRNA maturation RNase YbeY [Chloroflexota bacterium]